MLEIELDDLEVRLSEVLGRPARLISAAALGSSSRATPWRIDGRLDGEQVSFLLRYGESTSLNEVAALQAMADHPIPTPRVVYWDEGGAAGVPVFVSEFIDGTPLLPSMTAGEAWAIDLYLDTVCALQAINVEDLPSGTADKLTAGESIHQVIESAFRRFDDPTPLQCAVYQKLIRAQPPVLPEPAFSNGDLWPENMLVQDRELVGVIDWQHAGWSDPIFEFLLPFFLVPELRNRGVEERYLERLGHEPSLLYWYHGIELFETLSFVLELGEPFEGHTAETLTRDMKQWLTERI